MQFFPTFTGSEYFFLFLLSLFYSIEGKRGRWTPKFYELCHLVYIYPHPAIAIDFV